MKNMYLKFVPSPKYPKLRGGWKARTLFKLEGDLVMTYDNGQWSETKWPDLKKALEVARSIGFKLMIVNMTNDRLAGKQAFIDEQDLLDFPKITGSDMADALAYATMPKSPLKYGKNGPAKWEPEYKKECVHEPMEYIGFNSVQTICKKCDKTLA